MMDVMDTKQYLLSMYQPQGPIPEPAVLEGVMADLDVIKQELADRGAWFFGNGLHAPETATVLRAETRGGDVLVTDGPFTEGKEYLGGIAIFSAADLDEALDIGKRYARATGLAIEVRPFRG